MLFGQGLLAKEMILQRISTSIDFNFNLLSLLGIDCDRNSFDFFLKSKSSLIFGHFLLNFSFVSLYERSELCLPFSQRRIFHSLSKPLVSLLDLAHILLLVSFNSCIVNFCIKFMVFLYEFVFEFHLIFNLFILFLNLHILRVEFAQLNF